MKRNTTIPNSSKQDLITYELVVNGEAVSITHQVMSITVTKEINRIPSARIVFRDGDAPEGKFETSDGEEFIPGTKITIKLGRDRKNTTVFEGIVVRQQILIRESGNADLIVDCKDECIKMSIGRHNKYYENSKDSSVIEEIIGRYSGLQKDVEATSLEHKELVQHHCSDWDFILSRADVNGKFVIVDDGKVQVKAPKTNGSATLNVSFGSTLLEFEAEMDARTQWKSVEAKAWDYSNQRLFESESSSASVSEAGNISGSTLADSIWTKSGDNAFELRHSGQILTTELEQWAKAAMLKSRMAKICGRAKFIGFSDLKPGQLIDVQGVGDRFNGTLYVSGVRHDLAHGDWYTHAQFGIRPEWFARSEEILDMPAGGLLPGVYGLQVGKVVQLQEDPNGEHRILVRIPVLDNNARGVWSRVATLDAGDNRGSFFRPEIDDEVIVGFLNDDPRDPVVLGMLHSSAKPAPITAQDVNHEKAFVTRSDMRIHFHDETKTITISTPAPNTIKLDEESKSITITDQNNNKVKLEPGGITIDSPKDIKIKAGGKIEIEATTDLSMKAATIKATAQGPFEAKGATAKLAGSGLTEVTGSLVKIN